MDVAAYVVRNKYSKFGRKVSFLGTFTSISTLQTRCACLCAGVKNSTEKSKLHESQTYFLLYIKSLWYWHQWSIAKNRTILFQTRNVLTLNFHMNSLLLVRWLSNIWVQDTMGYLMLQLFVTESSKNFRFYLICLEILNHLGWKSAMI